jgi:DnaJ like chaperone protein
MTLTDLAVILFGLFAGYWVMSKLFFGSPKTTEDAKPAPPPSAPLPQWHEILQVGPSANAGEIRDAYKRMISLYHPDKVESLGPELRTLAIQKSQEITAAYREGMHARGADPDCNFEQV